MALKYKLHKKDLKSTVEEYSDARILNIIKQRNNYSKEQFNLAKQVATERKIVSNELLKHLSNYAEFKQIAEISLNEGHSKDNVLSDIHQNYKVPFELAKEIVEKANKSRIVHSWNPNKNFLLKIIGTIIFAYLLIKGAVELLNINLFS